MDTVPDGNKGCRVTTTDATEFPSPARSAEKSKDFAVSRGHARADFGAYRENWSVNISHPKAFVPWAFTTPPPRGCSPHSPPWVTAWRTQKGFSLEEKDVSVWWGIVRPANDPRWDRVPGFLSGKRELGGGSPFFSRVQYDGAEFA